MMKYFVNLLCLLLLATQVHSAETKAPIVNMETTFGTIVIELNAEKAPKTVKNFLAYVKEGFYEGTIFHRVIGDFMIQGGGFTPKYRQKETHSSIANEADNGLKNLRGTIAMARTNEPDSATSQFFINVVDNFFLDYKAPTRRGWGYAVFGKVIEGMDVVDRIKGVETGNGGPFWKDVPQTPTPIIIEKVFVVEEKVEEKIESKSAD